MRLLLLFLLTLTLRADPRQDYIIDTVRNAEVWSVSPTGSMKPGFDERWWLLVVMKPFGELEVGDVILWERGDLTICHRIVAKSSGGPVVLTSGDANGYIDSQLIFESIY